MKKKLLIIIGTTLLLFGLFSCTMFIKNSWSYWKQNGTNFMYKIANEKYDEDTPIAQKYYLCFYYNKNSSDILVGIHFPTSAAGTVLGDLLVGHSNTGTFYFEKDDGSEESFQIKGTWVATFKGHDDEPDKKYYFAANREDSRKLFDLFCENLSLKVSYGSITKTFTTDGFEESLEKAYKLTRNDVYEILK